ncbi:DUF932 domain-containing protein [Streptomyces sp. NPDC051662]|uniref:DUF932 domain-containing protein n=1 Tax=Streptomyces sp. NPDC051662 TaxID=3154750 RepID=UPI00343B04CB
MSHGLEVHVDGTASFVSANGVDAWHRLGTVTQGALTAEEALEKSYLSGWNVRKIGGVNAVEITEHGVTRIDSPDDFFTVRDNPKTGAVERLGTVGSKYEPVQNEAHTEMLNLLVDESGANFETAGSLHGGKNVFVTMKLPMGVQVGGFDRHDLYLAGLNSHDGSSAFRLLLSPTRVVCANTASMARRDAQASYSIRHTVGAKGKIAEARKALDIVFAYVESFEREAEKLINESMTLGEFEKVVEQIWPMDEPNPGKRKVNNHRARMGTLRNLFENAETQAAIRGTRWAGYNAITEYLDHHAPAGKNPVKAAEIRATRTLTTSSDATKDKQKAFDLLALAV